jgi:Right handed beta helix region
LRCSTGQVIWEMEHTVTLHEGDLPLSLPGLAAAIVKTAFNYQQSNTMRAASELCMQMTASIPTPPAEAEIPPLIQALVHNGAAGLLSPGDELRVVMIGDKKQKASLSLPPLILEAPMEEKEPGVYVASYRIQPQDRLAEGQLTGYLRSPSGSSRQWVDTLGPIRAGKPTVLPPVVSSDTRLTADQSPYLVEDALVVMPGAVLTMDPGVVVWFRSLGMVVRGTLQACGTAEHPVVFRSLKTRGWKGIFIDGGGGENLLRHCRISEAEFGIRCARARLVVEDCQLQENTWGVVAEEGQVDISGSLVRASGKTGIAVRKSRLAVNGSVVTENAAGGFLLEDTPAVIEGNNIVNNGGWGIKTVGPPTEVYAGGNWWGRADPDLSVMIKGPVMAHPLLPAPAGVGFARNTMN